MRDATVDDINPSLPYKDPRLWELWHIPYYGSCRISIINSSTDSRDAEGGALGVAFFGGGFRIPLRIRVYRGLGL